MVGSCETGIGAALMRMGDFEESQAALQRALVLTIDPARRLADALGGLRSPEA